MGSLRGGGPEAVPSWGVFVKICGITTEDDALLAVAMGADAVGFVFAPSTRQVHPRRVRDIVPRIPPEVLAIGVFKATPPDQVVEMLDEAGLRAAQLHDIARPEDCRDVAARVPNVIAAFRAGDPRLDRVVEYGADAILVDSPVPGSGQVFDWSVLDGAERGQRLILAGGLTPENVGDAIDVVRPWGVDVSTGVEQRPGHKDPAKVRRFVLHARHAAALLREQYEQPAGAAPFDWSSPWS
jgi:phosphoribosylanthranilate isomerase